MIEINIPSFLIGFGIGLIIASLVLMAVDNNKNKEDDSKIQ